MSKCERPGHITLTIEMPIEVAEWLALNADRLGHEARIATIKTHRTSKEGIKQNKEKYEKLKTDFWILGRVGYRKFRQAGVTKNFPKNRDLTRAIAAQLGVTWQTLELAATRFKRDLDGQLRKRRGREIGRLYWAGFSNLEIAERLNIHRNTVTRYITDVIKPTGRRA